MMTGAGEILGFLIPLCIGLGVVFYLLLPAILSTDRVQRFLAHRRGECYHEYKEFACRRQWRECGICASELNEPWHFHPVVVYKCALCGAEVTELDHELTRTLSDYMQLPQMEMVA